MSLTYTPVKDYNGVSVGNARGLIVDVTLDSSYATGGYAVAAASLSMRAVYAILIVGQNTAAAGYLAMFNATTTKLMAFRGGGFTPAGTVSAPTVTMAGSGAGGVASVNADASSGALTHFAGGSATGITGVQAPVFTGTGGGGSGEVAALTNLSALIFRALILGD